MKKNKAFSIHPVLLFTIMRYMRYVMQMLRGIIIAKYLGPYYLGVWGFITLALQYISYLSFGVENGITVVLSTSNKEEIEKQNQYSSASVNFVTFSAFLLFALGIIVCQANIELFPKFGFNDYLLLVIAATVMVNIVQVLTNIFRVKKALVRISIVEILTALMLLVIALIVQSEKVIVAQLYGMIFSSLIGIVIFVIDLPFKYTLTPQKNIYSSLMKISFPLFLYNVSFYLIMVLPRTVVSVYYSLIELGYYTLANSLATAALLGFRSVAWAIYPDVISRLQPSVALDDAKKNLKQLNLLYSTAVFLAIFISVVLMPLLVIYLPEYEPALPTITILLLSQAILAVSFGYNSLAVSRGRQNDVARIGIFVTIFVSVISLLIALLKLDYLLIAFTILGGSFLYTFFMVRLGLDILSIGENRWHEFKGILSPGTMASIIIFSIGVFTNYALLFHLAGLMIFFISSRDGLLTGWKFITDRTHIGNS